MKFHNPKDIDKYVLCSDFWIVIVDLRYQILLKRYKMQRVQVRVCLNLGQSAQITSITVKLTHWKQTIVFFEHSLSKNAQILLSKSTELSWYFFFI